ncbi:MAG TPA: glutamate--tRNA ligase family protein, partial [Candidatus Babeliales bacterium]|nr:glutamate--tRNA ligase family protein [Candidatus Babeliales bacterium]
ILMEISHVLRGDYHLTNTVNQILLYHAFGKPVQLFWHLPLICNSAGKKLSKRDFGFSLVDLQKAGFLPQAITNYLGILGASFTEEILPLDVLAQTANFDQIHSAGQIKYDVKKLEWLNHKWLGRLSIPDLVELCQPYLTAAHPDQVANLTPALISKLVQLVHTDLIKLSDIVPQTKFYFSRPDFTDLPLGLTPELRELFQAFINLLEIAIPACAHSPRSSRVEHSAIEGCCGVLANYMPPAELLSALQTTARTLNIPAKSYFPVLRTILTGQPTGPHVPEIIALLGYAETAARLQLALVTTP